MEYCTAEDAASLINSGQRVYLSSNLAQPQLLTAALYARRNELSDVEIVHLLTAGDAPYSRPECSHQIRHVAFFVSKNTREGMRAGSVDYLPIHLGDVPRLMSSGNWPIDVAIVATSPPDSEGFVSLGLSVDIGWDAVLNAKTLIAEVYNDMPVTGPMSLVHKSNFSAFINSNVPLLEHVSGVPDETSHRIASHVSPYIKDGDCLQVGIGHIPDAILSSLNDRINLGVHTELIGDGLIELYKNGQITGRFKPGGAPPISASFALCSRRNFSVLNNNPDIGFYPTRLINDPCQIGQIPNMVSINGALEVDLTGQVVSDSIGPEIYSGFGGQVDFVRGAHRSVGGRSFIVLPSTAQSGTISRIVPTLKTGAGVVTSRADVMYVATEYGAVNLFGLPLKKRAAALISLAHPSFRSELQAYAESHHLV